MSENWHINYSKEARQDILSIKNYFLLKSLSHTLINSKVKKVLDTIDTLPTFPNRHQRCMDEPWYSYGIRFMPIDNFIVFYLPDNRSKNILISRIMTSKNNFSQSLSLNHP